MSAPSFDAMARVVIVAVVLIAGLVLVAVVVAGVKGSVRWSRNNAAPVESVPASVATKRTDTRGGAGDAAASTSYFVTFELTDGTRLELGVRGSQFGQLADGDTGMLTRQGTRFKGFVRRG